jgi:hypothetical protein
MIIVWLTVQHDNDRMTSTKFHGRASCVVTSQPKGSLIFSVPHPVDVAFASSLPLAPHAKWSSGGFWFSLHHHRCRHRSHL